MSGGRRQAPRRRVVHGQREPLTSNSDRRMERTRTEAGQAVRKHKHGEAVTAPSRRSPGSRSAETTTGIHRTQAPPRGCSIVAGPVGGRGRPAQSALARMREE